MSQSNQRRLSAIMFTDMVGYSKLTQRSEALALSLLAEHNDILRPIFPKHGGTEIKTIGDAFLVEFGSALNAVECAVEIQETLRERNTGHPAAEPIRIRIGIHIGDVMHTADDILGDGVNIAARIYPLAPPEGICITEDVARQVQNKLGLPLHKLDRTQLKNIELSLEIYSVGVAWLKDVARPDKISHAHDRKPATGNRKIFLWSVAALLILAVIAGVHFLKPSSRGTGVDSRTIAVLPFANISGNAEEEYFSDGITEDILTQLCKVSELSIISRTTMMRYKGSGKSLREIGKELHAGVVLEGSVRRSGNRIRISSQLIDAVTDRHLWAETYDREIKDVFAIQSEIAQKIAAALQAKLSATEKAKLDNPSISNIEAYNLLLQGRHFASQRGQGNIARAVDLFKQALSIDPNDARVWASLANTYTNQADLGYVGNEEGYARARHAIERALSLDDRLAEAHKTMAWIKQVYDWDWTGAQAENQKAVTLEPGNVAIISDMASLSATLGRIDEAIALTRRAITLDPVSAEYYRNLGYLFMLADSLDEAADAFRKALELNPQRPNTHASLGLIYLLRGETERAVTEIQKEKEDIWRHYGLALAYHGAGRKAEAISALKKFIDTYQNEAAFQIAELYAYKGDADRAFEWLERAYVQRDGGLTEIKGDPFLKNITRDPRYAAFMKKMRLPL
jgi:adenylate cyclase